MLFFFFNDTATTEIYTLSLHDALPIFRVTEGRFFDASENAAAAPVCVLGAAARSEEHTSELQSQSNLVCRLLLEKKKKVNLTSMESVSTSSPAHSVYTGWPSPPYFRKM